MRILFCTNSLGAQGGIEKVTIVKANAFAEINNNEVAICFTDRGSYPYNLIHPLSEKLKVIDLGVPFWDLNPLNIKNIFVKAPRKFLKLRKAMKKCILNFRPDIVITTGSYEKYALATIRTHTLLGKPCAKIREYHFGSNYRDYLPLKSKISAMCAVFEHRVLGSMFDMNFLLTREDLETHFHGKKRYDFMYNPVTFSPQPRVPLDERDKSVIVVCRLTDQKNVQATIRAWASIKKDVSGWILRIVGDGDMFHELIRLVSILGVEDSVDFLGFRKDVPDLMRRSRILAMTSKYEGFGLNIVEAMACGTVPVAYRTPYGPADIITDGVDGILVDYWNEEKFAVALRNLILSPERMEEMSIAAMRRAQDFYIHEITSRWMVKFDNIVNS